MYGLLGLIVLIAVIVFYARGRNGRGGSISSAPPKPNCDWETTGEAKGRLQEYRCNTCRVTGYSSTGQPPIECKRSLKTGS